MKEEVTLLLPEDLVNSARVLSDLRTRQGVRPVGHVQIMALALQEAKTAWDLESSNLVCAVRRKAVATFTGDYEFLSNFHIEHDGSHVEGEYQKAKCARASDRKLFADLPPAAAKKLGRRVLLRPDWDSERVDVMRELVWNKFQEPSLARRLLDTGTLDLIEGNRWGDTFWGVCNGVGENMLGKILMETRKKLGGKSK